MHIASGKNIKTAKSLPIKLTKKMAHHFLKAPVDYNVSEALRWSQIHGLGGDERLVQIINATDLGREFRNEDFWQTVIQFFVNNPMLDQDKIQPIIDYIKHQKFETQQVYLGEGRYQTQPPPRPNFSMKGRTVEAIIRETEEWHDRVNRITRRGRRELPQTWPPIPVGSFEFKEGQKENKRTYRIVQLCSNEELNQEGRAMKHCVSSYVQSCASGRCSIWSLNIEDAIGQIEKLVTIELRNKTVVQVRGKNNRAPEKKEIQIMQRWMTKENLEISRWIH
jgi:hypothetical protein